MKKDNKKALYESIMTSVAKEVKRALNESHEIVRPRDKDELATIVYNAIKRDGKYCDLNWIDTSLITDMSFLFSKSEFDGDISQWNVSHVTDMSCMFEYSRFNGDISNWNVSNVKNMSFMFYNSKFNGDISNWNVSNVKYFNHIFKNCPIQDNYKPKFSSDDF